MKTLFFLAKIFPAKKPAVTCQQARVPTLGTPINARPTAEPDYSQSFRDWGWTR